MFQQQQPRQPVQQQPRQPVQQQPRQPVQQQQPRRPVQQQPPVQRPRVIPQPQTTPRPAPTPAPRPAPTPARAPAPAPTPARAPAPAPAPPKPAPSSNNGPEQTALTAFQRAILKNAGVTDIPTSITKVQRPKVNEPRVVQFLADEPTGTPQPQSGDAFFGPFEVFQPGAGAGVGGPLPDLQVFPAIPEVARNAPPLGDPNFGPFQIVDLAK